MNPMAAGTAGGALLALLAWIHFAVVIWVCFWLPTEGDWIRKIEAAGSLPGWPALLTANLIAAWLCRNRLPLWVSASMLALFDGMMWASGQWL